MSQRLESWEFLRIIRSTHRLSFTKDRNSEYIEEIVVKNEGSQIIHDFPLPIDHFLHGVEIFDEENRVLTLKSREQINQDIQTLNVNARLQIRLILENKYLLWIVLPQSKAIDPLDTKVIHIKYYFTSEPIYKKFSFFSFPSYVLYGKAGTYPISIYITCPASFQLKVNRSESWAYTDEEISQFQNKYLISLIDMRAFPYDLRDLISSTTDPQIPINIGNRISVFNKSNLISFVIPSGMPPLQYFLSFNIEIQRNDQIIWKGSIAATTTSLIIVLFLLKFYPVAFNALGDSKGTIFIAIGTALITVIATIMTFLKSFLLKKTRLLWGIPLILSIIIIIISG